MAESAVENREPVATVAKVPSRITAAQVIAVLLAIFALSYAQGLLAPLLVAVLASVALAPLVRVLSKVVPRALASAIVVIGIAGLIGLIAYSLSGEASAFSKRLPSIVREVRTAIVSASPRQGLIRQLQQAITELEKTTASPAPTNVTPVTIVEPVDVQQQLMSWARTLGNYLAQAILMLFLIYFLLASGDLFKNKLVKLSGDRLSQRKVTLQMIDEITSKIGRFVFYQAWSGALVGVITWLCFRWIGVSYAALWGVAAGVMNCIPYFGPTLIMAASAAAALIQFRSLAMMALVASVSLAVTALEGFLLAPMMLGQAARVNTVAVFVSFMFWGWLWGSLGLVIAVPVMMIVKTVADRVESLSALSELLGERERRSPGSAS
ncbi:MAG: AI-2E family transporter [Acidobacteriota bacterium]|nr:AI-2E family transporter [Acidobacteriota bacterium]